MLNNFLVTGCSQGLGHAIALQLSQADCHVYAISRNKVALEKLAQISKQITPIVADITTVNGESVNFPV